MITHYFLTGDDVDSGVVCGWRWTCTDTCNLRAYAVNLEVTELRFRESKEAQ